MLINDSTNPDGISTFPFKPLPPEARIPRAWSQNACPVFDHLCEYLRTWSPRSYEGFFEAVALFILSVIAAGRVTCELGKKRFTNLMIMLVGRTGISAKSTVASLSRFILHAIGLDFLLVPDLITPQKLVNIMSSKIPDNFAKLKNEDKEAQLIKIAFSGQRGYYHDEFGITFQEMVRSESASSLYRGLFRRLDDNDETFSLAGVTRGVDEIEHPYLAFLGCLTVADIATLCKQGSSLWNDGFLARFGIIASDEVLKRGVRFPKGARVLSDDIRKTLVEWHVGLGMPTCKVGNPPITTPPKGHCLKVSKEVEDAFYAYGDALLDIMDAQTCMDLDGCYVRFPEKAIRIAALFASLSGSDSIEICHWAKAQEITERWRESLHGFYNQIVTKTLPRKPSTTERVYRVVIFKGSPTRREIEQQTGLTSYDVQEALYKLIDAGEIREIELANTIRYEIVTRVKKQTDV